MHHAQCVCSTAHTDALVSFGLRSTDLLVLFAGLAYMLTGSLVILKFLPRLQLHYVDAVTDGLNVPTLFATQWLSAALGHATIMAFYAPQQRKLFGHSRADGGLSHTRSDCVVCQQERAAIALLPCGHMAVCSACSEALGFIEGVRPSSHCPICRARVVAWVRIYT